MMEAIGIILLMSLFFIVLSLCAIYCVFEKDLINLSNKMNKFKLLLFLELIFFCFTNNTSLAKAIKIHNEKKCNIKKDTNCFNCDENKYKKIDDFSIKINNDIKFNIKQ